MKLTVVKKNNPRSITGTDCSIASWREAEKRIERMRTTAKSRIGIFRGFMRIVTFFSITAFTPHNINKAREAPTKRICFGKVKKSVVIVRKKTGNRRKTVAVRIVATDVRAERAVLLFIV